MSKSKPSNSLEDNVLWAYETNVQEDMPVLAGAYERDWMNATRERFAYRCLPLIIANQAGWVILNPTPFRAKWNGGEDDSDLEIEFMENEEEDRIVSLFGCGIVTFRLPYLFRTPKGINLWVKGPSNWYRDGLHPLEGIVESDWTESTFTMNWKLTRPQHTVQFDQGDPICMVVPTPRGLLEQLDPRRVPLSQNPDLYNDYLRWSESRFSFSDALAQGEEETVRQGWQKRYLLGLDQDNRHFPEHQTRLELREFRRD